jgi:hypothetical protein
MSARVWMSTSLTPSSFEPPGKSTVTQSTSRCCHITFSTYFASTGRARSRRFACESTRLPELPNLKPGLLKKSDLISCRLATGLPLAAFRMRYLPGDPGLPRE